MNIKILWVDDEIELLKPHIMFLEGKGYEVLTTNNGSDAIDMVQENVLDIVFLDENMPGLSGLETLDRLKNIQPGLPVVMITKSEEESIMEGAIGGKISDYLIKPVNPNQILLSLKKNLENKKWVSEKTTMDYQREFREIGIKLSDKLDFEQWQEVYNQLVHWEIELSKSDDGSLLEIFQMQKNEANSQFGSFIRKNYADWLSIHAERKPVLSHTVFRDMCLPFIKGEEKTFLVVVDNLRYDQWKILKPAFEEVYRIASEEMYCSILPTATQFARNAFFAGMLPTEIEKRYPQYWVNESEESTFNKYESELLAEQLKRLGADIKFSYHKILNLSSGKKLAETINNYTGIKLNVLVYNFVDMLSHARTEMEVIKELADNEAAYRSLTLSWFEHSPLRDIIKVLARNRISLILTTDHGSIKVYNPSKVVGDKNTNTNLRYKTGRNLQFDKSEVFAVANPQTIYLPKSNISSNYIFALNNSFFAYPNNYNHYVNYYRDTFQHGGVSLEEMLVPLVFMRAK